MPVSADCNELYSFILIRAIACLLEKIVKKQLAFDSCCYNTNCSSHRIYNYRNLQAITVHRNNMASIGNLLMFACLMLIIRIDCEPMEIWGDITTATIVGSAKSKYAIPFFTRSVTITYPNVSIIVFYTRQQ